MEGTREGCAQACVPPLLWLRTPGQEPSAVCLTLRQVCGVQVCPLPQEGAARGPGDSRSHHIETALSQVCQAKRDVGMGPHLPWLLHSALNRCQCHGTPPHLLWGGAHIPSRTR